MQFRILTNTHYEMSDSLMQKAYGTNDPNEAAQIEQANLRDDGSALYELMSDEGVETTVYVQVFDPGGQMFMDEFIREVIGIIRMEDLEIHINYDDPNRRVHARLVGIDDFERISLDGYGKTMGFALRDVRDQLRGITGK